MNDDAYMILREAMDKVEGDMSFPLGLQTWKNVGRRVGNEVRVQSAMVKDQVRDQLEEEEQ